MNVLKRLTLINLKMNRKRTALTMTGIALATALITLVGVLVASFTATMIQFYKTTYGDFHFSFKEVPVSETEYITNNRNITNYTFSTDLGFVKINDGEGASKQYICIKGMNAQAMNQTAIKVLEGRLPENEDELVISKPIISNACMDYHVGDRISLEVGDLCNQDGTLIRPSEYTGDESLKVHENKSYTITGIIEKPSQFVEDYDSPGYTAITFNDQGILSDHAYVDFFTQYTKDALKNRVQVTADIVGSRSDLIKLQLDRVRLSAADRNEIGKAKFSFDDNGELIKYQSVSLDNDQTISTFVIAGIVLAIILFTGAICIRNSFDISITDKMKQYGMLASVGATRKQIKKNVYFEAAILGAIGIPAGILFGILFGYILSRISGPIFMEAGASVFLFRVSWFTIILAIVISVIMIAISAGKPARKAAKITAIEAIRESGKIKITDKNLKAPGFIKKTFGSGGNIAYKNMRRNKRNYRVITISIIISIVMFIPLNYLIDVLYHSVEQRQKLTDYNIVVTTPFTDTTFNKLQKYTEDSGINQMSILNFMMYDVPYEQMKYSEEYLTAYNKLSNEVTEEERKDRLGGFVLVGVGEKEYKDYVVNKLGLDYDSVANKGIIYSDAALYDANHKKVSLNHYYDYKKGDSINGEVVKYKNDDSKQSIAAPLEVAAVTDMKPFGVRSAFGSRGLMIVSDQFILDHKAYVMGDSDTYIRCDDPDSMERQMLTDQDLTGCQMMNMKTNYRQMHSLIMIIKLFLYGFIVFISCISIANMFNTITTGMELRSREFAMLRAVGMTHKEFNRMICLENVFFGAKALLIGLPIGVLLSIVLREIIKNNLDTSSITPVNGVIISAIAVMIILFIIMRYSLHKIYKQNIIETIRRDNI